MNMASRSLAFVAAFVAVWMAPVLTVLASPPHGEAENVGEQHHAPDGGGIKWLGDGFLGGPGEDGKTGFLLIIINFVALLFILNKILFKGLIKRNEEASDAIRLELERATRARSEAEALVHEYEDKLTALETEVAEIKATAKQSAKAEHARILADAEEQAVKIRDAALRAAEREAARYRTEIENEIVEQAVARAEAAIRKSFAGADQRRLVDAWVEEVSSTSISTSASGGAN